MIAQGIHICLESGIGGGSFSLFENGQIIHEWISETSSIKSENLLSEIETALNKNSINKSQIEKISYSINPGSQTGLKIGSSIVKALELSLEIEMHEKDLFQCIYSSIHTTDEKKLIMLPTGRKNLEWRLYKNATESLPGNLNSVDELLNIPIREFKRIALVMPDDLIAKVSEQILERFSILVNEVRLVKNLSVYLR